MDLTDAVLVNYITENPGKNNTEIRKELHRMKYNFIKKNFNTQLDNLSNSGKLIYQYRFGEEHKYWYIRSLIFL